MNTYVVEYSVSDAAIEQLRERLEGLTAETPQKYEEVRQGIAEVRTLRVAVEKTRKELKKDALEYGRKVDAEAKRITQALLTIEEPLKLEKAKIDDEKERIRREAEEAERRKREEEEARKRAEEEAKRKAEEERIRKEQEAERKRLEAERAELEKQRKVQEEAARKEREEAEARRREEEAKLAEERRKVEEERQRLEREKFEREAKERAEREAKEKAERERIEAEERARKQEELRKLRAAQAPDKEKLRAFGEALNAVEVPAMATDWGHEVMSQAIDDLDSIIHALTTADNLQAST